MVNDKFASLILRFIAALELTTFMQASLYGIQFVENKGNRSICCFNWKTSLKKKTVFSALANDTGFDQQRLIWYVFTCGR